ncbi:tRNA(Ile)-lysidine synthase [Alternaria panax]|uniref:tRNA(Ile)-lysidine synthetase n=1 Tax=Alternaria panax TaxID=48097 RepID=A0AAD4I690_9PLEO|nr:tRNA(Ile)-lysidine synthase [Alternaria panax]
MREGALSEEQHELVARKISGGMAIAISGGVDSMALAALYTQARERNSELPEAHGLIVDHKVRSGSTQEAKWVQSQLRLKFDMLSTIIPLTWPDRFNLQDVKRFETEARTLRYQALGRACRDMQITRLLVAHHADDQAETVMMRLANNRLRSGLQAMQRKEWIPECEGMYGVHHSGAYQKPNRSLDIPFPVERGGINIFRPLLTFEKTRLVATCREKGVVWAEDDTNQIKTLTSRNAIRHIYKNHKLPEALSIKSLVDVSQHMQERIKRHRTLADELFDKCLIKLDIQTGCLVVRFPPFSDLLPQRVDSETDKTDKIYAKNTAYCLLERVAELVTPSSKAPLGPLAATVHHIYPELDDPEGDEQVGHWNRGRKKNYCVYNLWWRFWHQPSPFDRPEHQEASIDPSSPHPREWLLTRQPIDALEITHAKNVFVYPPQTRPREEKYVLVDGRYWILLRNRLTHDKLVLRIFSKDDMVYLPTHQQNKDQILEPDDSRPYRYIKAAFDLLKPADLRYTLPAVFRINEKTGEQSLVGFPTLGVRTYGFGAPESVCEWSVRYKKIDFGSRSAGDLIVPGTSRKDIVAEEMRMRKVFEGIEKAQKAKELKKGRKQNREGTSSDTLERSKSMVHVDGRDSKSRVWKAAAENVQKMMEAEETDALRFLEQKSRK